MSVNQICSKLNLANLVDGPHIQIDTTVFALTLFKPMLHQRNNGIFVFRMRDQIKPMGRHLIAKIGQLPFSKMPGMLLNQCNTIRQFSLTVKIWH
jgi:hypothetical protein